MRRAGAPEYTSVLLMAQIFGQYPISVPVWLRMATPFLYAVTISFTLSYTIAMCMNWFRLVLLVAVPFTYWFRSRMWNFRQPCVNGSDNLVTLPHCDHQNDSQPKNGPLPSAYQAGLAEKFVLT